MLGKRLQRWSCVLVLAVVWVSISGQQNLQAAEPTGFVDRVFKDEAGEHKYVVFVPKRYSAQKTSPAILYLHGAGERGTDGRKPLTVGLGPYIKQRMDSFPFIVVFPQCEDMKGQILTGWSADSPDGRRALEIFKDVEETYRVDPAHRILTGWSMGGYGTWSIAAATPGEWSAVVPMAGGGDVATASALKDATIWSFHGADDKIVPAAESRKMVEAVNAAGGHARNSEIAGVAHNVWQYAYANGDLYRWMLDPAAYATAETRFRAKPGERPPLEATASEPFIPAIEIPNAVYVRMGNDMLDSLAESVPRIVPRDVLTGGIGDIVEGTMTSGYYFNVRFSQISYTGTVERAIVKAYRKDRLNIQLGLRNVVLRIGRTFVSGDGRSATAGPIDVVIGANQPVWLSLALQPYVDQRKLRLNLVATRFDIPSDNWYVSGPAGVSTSGLGMTSEKVSSGLVSGIYGKKGRIEYEVRAVVPKLIERLEQQLERKDLSELVGAFWPLPVYHPRLRVWPQEVLTDENGISLAMGITAAAVDARHAPRKPRLLDPAGPALSDLPRGRQLEVGLAPDIINPLTELLIEADVARINVRDIPEKRFATLADRAALAEAIPELRRFGDSAEVWAELVLTNPLSMLDSPAPPDAENAKPNIAEASAESRGVVLAESTTTDNKATVEEAPPPPPPRALRISAPKVVVSLAVRPDAKSEWKPFAQIDLSVAQEAVASVDDPNSKTRELKFEWKGEPIVEATARFAEGYEPQDKTIDVPKLRGLFLDAWRGWTQQGPLAEAPVRDIDFGYTKLRLKGADWTGQYLMLAFGKPGIKITNRSDVDLVYETKTPDTAWGGPHTLPPGKMHEYPVAYPLWYRQVQDGQPLLFTLPAGMNFEFRSPGDGRPPRLFQAREKPSMTPLADEPKRKAG